MGRIGSCEDLEAKIEGALDAELLEGKLKACSGSLTLESCIPLFSGLFGLVAEAHDRMKRMVVVASSSSTSSTAAAAGGNINKRARLMLIPRGNLHVSSVPPDPNHRWNRLKDKRKEDAMRTWNDIRARMMAATPQDGQQQQQLLPLLLAEAFKALVDESYLLRVDLGNIKLRGIVPVICEHGVTYEKKMFSNEMEAGKTSLEATKAWIKHSMGKAEQQQMLMQQISHGDKVIQFISRAIVDLVVEYPHWGGVVRLSKDMDKIPETLKLDLLRIKALNAHFHTDVACMVIVATTMTTTGTGSGSGNIDGSPVMHAAADAAKVARWAAALVKEHPPRPLNPADTIKLIRDGLVDEHGRDEAQADSLAEMLQRHLSRAHNMYAGMV